VTASHPTRKTFSADSPALRDGGNGSPHAQFAAAKALVYNANRGVASLIDGF